MEGSRPRLSQQCGMAEGYFRLRAAVFIIIIIVVKRLSSAAKKALSKIPTKSIKSGDKELQDVECCAVCIEPYKMSDVLRILPCRGHSDRNSVKCCPTGRGHSDRNIVECCPTGRGHSDRNIVECCPVGSHSDRNIVEYCPAGRGHSERNIAKCCRTRCLTYSGYCPAGYCPAGRGHSNRNIVKCCRTRCLTYSGYCPAGRGHEFHKTCIDPWLLEHHTCPMCKMDILKHYGFVFTGSQESILHMDIEEVVGLDNSDAMQRRNLDTQSPQVAQHQISGGVSSAREGRNSRSITPNEMTPSLCVDQCYQPSTSLGMIPTPEPSKRSAKIAPDTPSPSEATPPPSANCDSGDRFDRTSDCQLQDYELESCDSVDSSLTHHSSNSLREGKTC
uniref:RING-type domain-containing protein n=1 Tax=Timema poppense TaxID=170557 RepID=A0A7R9DK54_TIMPO|nr:unnamed protein product [Timema poppensis]